MEFFKKVRNFLWIFFLFSCITAGIDYYRLTIGKIPIFCIKEYNERTKIESYRGFFYIAERTVKWDRREALNLSSNIKYQVLTKELTITLERPKQIYHYVLYVTPDLENQESTLYYETKNQKLYFNGIKEIEIKKEKDKKKISLKEAFQKDPKLLEDIMSELSLTGQIENNKMEKYIAKKDTFVLGDLFAYRCHNELGDIYFTNKEEIQEDYCVVKDDSTLKEQEQ